MPVFVRMYGGFLFAFCSRTFGKWILLSFLFLNQDQEAYLNESGDDQLIALILGLKDCGTPDNTALVIPIGWRCWWSWWHPLRKGHFSASAAELLSHMWFLRGHLGFKAGCTSQKYILTAHNPACSLAGLLQTVTNIVVLIMLPFDG